MTWIIILLWVLWLSKPIYWLIRHLYAIYKDKGDFIYLNKLQKWLLDTWNYLKWSKEDF